MRFAAGFVVLAALAACSAPSGGSSTRDCGGAVQSSVGGEAIMGAGSDGFVQDTDLVFSARVTPGAASGNCTTVGVTLPAGQSF